MHHYKNARVQSIQYSIMSIFEAVSLLVVALAGTLLLFVSQRTIDASDAMRIYLLIGSFTSTLLSFYAPSEQVLRLWLAIAAIPAFSKVTAWLFAVQPPSKPDLSKMHQP